MDEPADAHESEKTEPIPLSALQHAVYCLRQAALIHLERQWEENKFTAEGRVLHTVAEKPGTRKDRGVRRVMALPLASRRLGIVGVGDLVEFHKGEGAAEIPYPVEYKRGKPKTHRADEVQLCAQGLCLEEMTGSPVPEGALFYGETKRRVIIHFDADLRAFTENIIAELAQVFASQKTPPPTQHKEWCRACSLLEICKPHLVAKPVLAWRNRILDQLLADGAEPT